MPATVIPFPPKPDPDLTPSVDLLLALAARIADLGGQSLALRTLEQARAQVA
jgi:hypothetical protein